MLIELKSKQIFEQHVDNLCEEHECDVIFFDDGFKISYEGCNIQLTGDKLVIGREYMKLEVEVCKVNISKMITPYGEVSLEIEGQKINWSKEPFFFETRYLIKLGNTQKYINELQILVKNK